MSNECLVQLDRSDLNLKNLSSAFNTSTFTERVCAYVKETNPEIGYGDYLSKVMCYGHIKVLKALGLYKTVGRGSSKTIMIHPTVKFIVQTTISSNKRAADAIISLFRGNLNLLSINISEDRLLEYNALKDYPIIREHGDYSTYIIHNPFNNLYKIGRSKNIFSRLNDLKNEHGQQLKLISYATKDIEALLHFEYKTLRMHGEWFDIDLDTVLDISNKHGFEFNRSL